MYIYYKLEQTLNYQNILELAKIKYGNLNMMLPFFVIVKTFLTVQATETMRQLCENV